MSTSLPFFFSDFSCIIECVYTYTFRERGIFAQEGGVLHDITQYEENF
ncbi:hypothetical protein PthstB1num2_32330 [Parageobacillus thermoglucosidasius]|uniref:Uncharacterized protein n=1 Tax=Geobacillus sp. (strain Y4.1MC1) TaxID=581103 RepID=A0A7U3YC66_GEOS0|nr:hypothetical protein Geoth_0055 [Parageobacillus thermoglucosidasius C56-YS93]GCD84640.1 hypothetical protein PTHTG4_37050 [Parageobacillus thermoglucosidasius]GMO01193.1 hypothetical protein PthstB1num2_32330 [Parageobacillus thermoglucosidasius]